MCFPVSALHVISQTLLEIINLVGYFCIPREAIFLSILYSLFNLEPYVIMLVLIQIEMLIMFKR